MYLTRSNLADYLVSRGTISAGSVVDGDFMLVELGRRNRNFQILRERAPSLFVKQIRTSDPQAMYTLRREAACYELARSNPRFGALRGLMPRLVDHDPARCSLTVESQAGENLTEYHQRTGTFPEHVGRLLGEAIGTYHTHVASALREASDVSLYSGQVPWVLRFDLDGAQALAQFGSVGAQIQALLRQSPQLLGLLAGLRAEWRCDSLTHGDIKWDNCVIAQGALGREQLRIVDWELVDFGDASWDVGAVFYSYLAHWIMAVPVPGAAADALLRSMHPALRAFWQAYVGVRGLPPAATRDYLLRCVRFGGARLVHGVVEYAQHTTQLTPQNMALMHAGGFLLADPARAAMELLAL